MVRCRRGVVLARRQRTKLPRWLYPSRDASAGSPVTKPQPIPATPQHAPREQTTPPSKEITTTPVVKRELCHKKCQPTTKPMLFGPATPWTSVLTPGRKTPSKHQYLTAYMEKYRSQSLDQHSPHLGKQSHHKIKDFNQSISNIVVQNNTIPNWKADLETPTQLRTTTFG